MTTDKIDWTKPIEFEDGRPAKFLRREGRLYIVTPPGRPEARGGNYYNESGYHYGFARPRVPNVAPPEPTLSLDRPLQTRSGTPAKFLAHLLDEQRILVEIVERGAFSKTVSRIERRDMQGRVVGSAGLFIENADDIINVPEKDVTTFRNVYADGTMGATAHKTFSATSSHSKYGKVRIGIMEMTHRADGEFVSSKFISTIPFKASATGGEYARK